MSVGLTASDVSEGSRSVEELAQKTSTSSRTHQEIVSAVTTFLHETERMSSVSVNAFGMQNWPFLILSAW